MSALHAHHFGGTAPKYTPLKVAVIAAKAIVAAGSVTNFFKKWVLHRVRKPDGSYERTENGSYAVYKRMCKDDLKGLERLLDELAKTYNDGKETGPPKCLTPSASNIADKPSTNTKSLGDDNPLDDRIDADINARSSL